MTHLGTQLSALADGQLAPADAERALAHVAGCPECATELAAARAARRAVAAAFEVQPTAGLTARLIALGAVGAGEPAGVARRDLDPGSSVPLPGTSPRLPAGCLRGDLPRRRTVPRTGLAVTGASLGLLAVVLFVLGGQVLVTPQRHPAHVLTVLGRAGAAVEAQAASRVARLGPVPSARTVSLAGAAPTGPVVQGAVGAQEAASTSARPMHQVVTDWLTEHPWGVPVQAPDGYQVAAVRVDPDGRDGLEVDLLGPSGLIVVTQVRGCLAAHGLPAPVAVAGQPVHVLSVAPWHAVWQSGDTVLSVAAEIRSVAAESVVASFPAQACDDDIPTRIARGWQVLAAVWSGS